MSEVVERVAAALCAGDGLDPERLRAVGALRTYAGTGEDEWATYLRRARNALKAVREPTAAMIASVKPSKWYGEDRYPDPDDTFRTMIDAALGDWP